jgi:hypothetical protein
MAGNRQRNSLRAQVYVSVGELNAGCKFKILSWIGEADRFADIFINISQQEAGRASTEY